MQPNGPLGGAPLNFPAGASGLTFVVGPPGSGAPFSSIQAAIDSAASGGAGIDAPAVVIVLPGLYVEDVTMAAGVTVFGFAARLTVVNGSVTFDLPAGTPPEQNFSGLIAVTVRARAGQNAVEFLGANYQTAIMRNCQVFPNGASAVVVNNTGTNGGDPSFLATATSLVEDDLGTSPLLIDVTAGLLIGTLGNFTGRGNVVGLDVGAAGGVQLLTTNVSVPIRVAGFLLASNTDQAEAAGLPGLEILAGAQAFWLFGSIGSDQTPAIDGAGSFGYGPFAYTGSGTGIAPTLTVLGGTPVQGAETLIYEAAVPGNWAGAPPTRVQDAIDRMAALLFTLNAGPIP